MPDSQVTVANFRQALKVQLGGAISDEDIEDLVRAALLACRLAGRAIWMPEPLTS